MSVLGTLAGGHAWALTNSSLGVAQAAGHGARPGMTSHMLKVETSGTLARRGPYAGVPYRKNAQKETSEEGKNFILFQGAGKRGTEAFSLCLTVSAWSAI